MKVIDRIMLMTASITGLLLLGGCVTVTDNQTSTSSKPATSQSPAQSAAPSANPAPQKEPAQKAKVEVVSSKEKKSEYGASSVIGEVINNGTAPASYVKVTATFYDANEQVVDTAFTYAGDTSSVQLNPGSKTPFEIVRMEDIKFDHYKLDVTWNDQ